MTTRMENVGRVSGRRHWTIEQKLAILRDAFGPKGSVRAAIERHEVGSGAIYPWRRQAMSGALTGITKPAVQSFAEVQISEPAVKLPAPSSTASGSGQIGIELPSGVRLPIASTTAKPIRSTARAPTKRKSFFSRLRRAEIPR